MQLSNVCALIIFRISFLITTLLWWLFVQWFCLQEPTPFILQAETSTFSSLLQHYLHIHRFLAYFFQLSTYQLDLLKLQLAHSYLELAVPWCTFAHSSYPLTLLVKGQLYDRSDTHRTRIHLTTALIFVHLGGISTVTNDSSFACVEITWKIRYVQLDTSINYRVWIITVSVQLNSHETNAAIPRERKWN